MHLLENTLDVALPFELNGIKYTVEAHEKLLVDDAATARWIAMRWYVPPHGERIFPDGQSRAGGDVGLVPLIAREPKPRDIPPEKDTDGKPIQGLRVLRFLPGEVKRPPGRPVSNPPRDGPPPPPRPDVAQQQLLGAIAALHPDTLAAAARRHKVWRRGMNATELTDALAKAGFVPEGFRVV